MVTINTLVTGTRTRRNSHAGASARTTCAIQARTSLYFVRGPRRATENAAQRSSACRSHTGDLEPVPWADTSREDSRDKCCARGPALKFCELAFANCFLMPLGPKGSLGMAP